MLGCPWYGNNTVSVGKPRFCFRTTQPPGARNPYKEKEKPASLPSAALPSSGRHMLLRQCGSNELVHGTIILVAFLIRKK